HSGVPAYPVLIRLGIATGACALLIFGTGAWRRRLGFAALLGLAIFEIGWSVLFYKGLYVFENIMGFRPDFPLRRVALGVLGSSNHPQVPPLPPRSLIPLQAMPQNDAMIYHFSHCDGYTSLFLERPWRYAHRLRQVPEPVARNTFYSPQIYTLGPSAYPEF